LLLDKQEKKIETMTNSELKAKVMTLGNKLAPYMGDRRTAFVQAWAIVKAGGLEVAVRGVSFGNRQEVLRRLATYNPAQVRAVLVPEPANPADPATVTVMVGVQGGKGLYRLGYVPRNLAPVAAGIGHRCGNQPGNFIRGEDTLLPWCFRSLPDGIKRIPIQFFPNNDIPGRDTHPQQYMIYAVS
jgi:uncharacterized protein YecE (DUF72 family)